MMINDKNSNRLIVVGSIVQDLVSYVERFPNPGESIRGKQFKMSCGGKGANQAVMAAILGANVSMVGRVGSDVFGDLNINSIKSFGVETSLIKQSSTSPTAAASVCVTDDGENCIVVTLGANLELNAEQVCKLEAEISSASCVLCQSEIDQSGNLETFKLAKKHNVTTFFNPAPGLPDLEKEIVTLTDIICTNENEAEFITGLKLTTVEDYKEAAKKILTLGPRISIITMGPKGALVAQRNPNNKDEICVENVPSPKVVAVDTTGAGDCFCGTFAYFYTQNPSGDVVDMVRRAVTAAAISVTKHGAQMAYPTREELIQKKVL